MKPIFKTCLARAIMVATVGLAACGGGSQTAVDNQTSVAQADVKRKWPLAISFPSVKQPSHDVDPIVLTRAADGDMDATFGTDGIIKYPQNTGPGMGAWPVTVKSRGFRKGFLAQIHRHVWAFDKDGKIDASFGNQGKLQDVECSEIEVLPDNKILCMGTLLKNIQTTQDLFFHLRRYLPDGTADTRFGTNGEVVDRFATTPDTHSMGQHISVKGDGTLLLTGRHGDNSIKPYSGQVGLAHLSANGQFMTTLGGTGRTTLSITDDAVQSGKTVFEDGGNLLVEFGVKTNGANGDAIDLYYAAVDLESGKLDPYGRFGSPGFLLKLKNFQERIAGLEMKFFWQHNNSWDAKGKFVSFSKTGLMRYANGSDGIKDPAFNNTEEKFLYSEPVMITALPDGKYLLPSFEAWYGKGVLHRLNADGSTDTSFIRETKPQSVLKDRLLSSYAIAEPDYIWTFGGSTPEDNWDARNTFISRRTYSSLCDNTPVNNFSLPYRQDMPYPAIRSTVSYAQQYIVSGLTKPAPLWIWGGEYAVNRSAFTKEPTMVSNGQVITVRTFSSDQAYSMSEATVTIGCGAALRSATFQLPS